MTAWGIAMMRNEEDVAGWVVRHMLDECDGVVVADNASTDKTRDILDAIAERENGRLVVVDEPRMAYYQDVTMNRLANIAATDHGADWIVPFDADEWWYAGGRTIAAALAACEAQVAIIEPTLMIPQPDDPADEPNPFLRCTWSRPERQYQKIAFRPGPDRRLAMGNHHLASWAGPQEAGVLAGRHLPYRTMEQAKAKLRWGKAALDATDMPSQIGYHWREYGAFDDATFAAWWGRWTDRSGLVQCGW